MINTVRVLKVSLIWTSIVYAICYLGVAIFLGIRPWFLLYGLHMIVNVGEDVLTITTFISGLVIWNLVAAGAVWLFAVLFNKIKN